MAVKQKYLDMAMRIICERFQNNPPSEFVILNAGFLYRNGFPAQIDAEHVLQILDAQGYIDYKPKRPSNERSITLLPLGKAYFETRAEEKRKERRKNRHDWLIAIFSALAGAFLSAPLWGLIRWIVRLLRG